MKNTEKIHEANPNFTNRRDFLKIGGFGVVGAGLLMAVGCSDDDDATVPAEYNNLPGVRNGVFDIGGGDFGVLTYAYALEQLEADFYTKVVANFGSYSEEAKDIYSDLHKHEVIHREFFKAALSDALPNPSTQLLPNLTFSYGNLDFTSQSAVTDVAIKLEDTGVSAYNGAGKLITNAAYLVIAGQIVSVEARHASAVRDLKSPGTNAFANTTDANGLDPALDPSAIITAVKSLGLITTPFTAAFLP